mmetsp:Transcript_31857/g.28893  ORF Transcript_31857/g.28893 Transcript_31857/m.28893 type:complete len:216 (+) Transcript_31857:66-713(+)
MNVTRLYSKTYTKTTNTIVYFTCKTFREYTDNNYPLKSNGSIVPVTLYSEHQIIHKPEFFSVSRCINPQKSKLSIFFIFYYYVTTMIHKCVDLYKNYSPVFIITEEAATAEVDFFFFFLFLFFLLGFLLLGGSSSSLLSNSTTAGGRESGELAGTLGHQFVELLSVEQGEDSVQFFSVDIATDGFDDLLHVFLGGSLVSQDQQSVGRDVFHFMLM